VVFGYVDEMMMMMMIMMIMIMNDDDLLLAMHVKQKMCYGMIRYFFYFDEDVEAVKQ
jgi:hypothetical protein